MNGLGDRIRVETENRIFAALRFVKNQIIAGDSKDEALAKVRAEGNLSEKDLDELKDFFSNASFS